MSTKTIRFRVDGVVGKGRPRFWQGHAVTPPATRLYEKAVKEAASRAIQRRGGWDKSLPMRVGIIAVEAVPASWPKAKRASALSHLLVPQKKPDIDNVAKAILDGMSKTVYEDDTQVYSLFAEKVYSSGKQSRVLVVVEAGL